MAASGEDYAGDGHRVRSFRWTAAHAAASIADIWGCDPLLAAPAEVASTSRVDNSNPRISCSSSSSYSLVRRSASGGATLSVGSGDSERRVDGFPHVAER